MEFIMKISFSKEALIAGIAPVLGAVPTNGTLAYTNGILLETAENNDVYITAYDTGKGIRSRIQAEIIHQGGSYIFNAQKLYQIVKLMPDGLNIDISVDESRNVEIKSGKSSFSLFAIPGSEFPNLPDLVGKRGFHIDGGILKKMISRVIHSVADQDARPMLCGAFFRIRSDRLHVVSCDSYTLSECSAACEISDVTDISTMNSKFIIPGHALGELVRLLPDEGRVITVMLSAKHVIVKLDNIIFLSRLIDSEYIDYERIIPKAQTIYATVDRQRLLSGLERANLVADEKIQGSGRTYVKIVVSGDRFALTSSSANGKVYDEMHCEHMGDDIEIGFNCRYLINSVRAATSEHLVISFKNSTQSITMEAPESEKSDEESFFYMVLPVRMNG